MPKLRGFGKKKWQKDKPHDRKPPSRKEESEEKCRQEYKLPSDLRELVDKSLKTIEEINTGLYLNKYAGFSGKGESDEIKIANQCVVKMKKLKSPDMYRYFLKKQETFFQSLENTGYNVGSLKGVLKNRMVVGLGSESIYETSITLHRSLGIPYIPGSALKGVAHHYAVETESESVDNIFGTQQDKGKVIFFDAFPMMDGNILDMDIMNPHYSDYYTKGVPPGDWMKPKPINFLTVKSGVEYRFYLASREEKLLKEASSLLKHALQENGVGAKTSLGYGRFGF